MDTLKTLTADTLTCNEIRNISPMMLWNAAKAFGIKHRWIHNWGVHQGGKGVDMNVSLRANWQVSPCLCAQMLLSKIKITQF